MFILVEGALYSISKQNWKYYLKSITRGQKPRVPEGAVFIQNHIDETVDLTPMQAQGILEEIIENENRTS